MVEGSQIVKPIQTSRLLTLNKVNVLHYLYQMVRFTKKQMLRYSALLLFLSFVAIVLIKQHFEEKYQKEMLQNVKSCKAVLVLVHFNTENGGSSYGRFKYSVNNVNYIFKERGDYRSFKIGDTVVIEYATKDHSVARVKDKFYMKKYGLKN